MADLVITGGRLIDPASGLDTPCTLLIQDGRIAHIGNQHGGGGASEGGAGGSPTKVDANGCLVTPGLIDCHVHAYEHATPLGLSLDGRCLSRGVTTAVDAGSAGHSTVAGLRKFIEEPSQCRLFAFLHIAAHGLAAAGCASLRDGGECDSLNQLDEDACAKTICRNFDFLVGVKVRLAKSVANNGENEQEAYRRALEAARAANVPVMVHHAFSSVPTAKSEGQLSCPGDLQAGDIYTHCFHGHPSGIADLQTGQVRPEFWEAKRRGVLFDIGHGAGAFAWRTAEVCAKEGFWPDIISTDLHTVSMDGPAYDLPTVMTKLMHVGMPLRDVISAVTSSPAAAIGKDDELGMLQVGREADITILRIADCDVELEDCLGETRRIRQRIMPVRVFRAGKEYPITDPSIWPNPDSKEQGLINARKYKEVKN